MNIQINVLAYKLNQQSIKIKDMSKFNVIQFSVTNIQIYPLHYSNNLQDNDFVDLLIVKSHVSLQKGCIYVDV